jgi:iron complex transport system ATP-binding protein
MIQVDQLEYCYRSNQQVLDKVTFTGEQGRCMAILGNNGAGKSTLLQCIGRILAPQGGSILVEGKDATTLRRQDLARKMAYVPQQGERGSFTVYDSVLLGRRPYLGLWEKEEDHQVVSQVLARMGLEPLALRPLDELSGGELQKVMIARALVQQPKVLLLDEPTSSLDLHNQFEVLSLVRQICREEQLCVVMVLHDLNLALRFCDRFLFLQDQKVLAFGGPEVMTEENIQAVYHLPVVVTRVQGVPVVVPGMEREKP